MHFSAWSILFVVLWHLAFHASTLFDVAPHTSAWYPASGIGFAFVLFFGWRFWLVYVAILLAHLDPLILGFSTLQALRQAAAYGGGALVLRWLLGGSELAPSFRKVLVFVFVVLGAALLSGTLASLIYLHFGLVGSADAASVMLSFWIGDATGVLVISPLLLLLIKAALTRSAKQPPGWALPCPHEIALHVAPTLAYTAALFWFAGEVGPSHAPEFLLLLPVILVAVAGGHRAITLILPIVTMAPARLIQTFGLHTSVIQLQTILLTNAVLGLLIGAVVSERRSLLLRLLDHQAELEDAVRLKTQHLQEEIVKREKAQQAKSRFLATVSHDCRQPLQSLTLMLSLMSRRYQSAEDTAFLSQIQRSVTSLTEFFKELMDLARMESGAVVVRPRFVDIGGMLERLRPDFEMLAEERSLSLRVVDCSATVVTDPTLLERAVRNLVGNAIRYTPRGGVLIGCRRRGDRVRLDVIDTGAGIAAHEQERIFEEFYRASDRNADEGRGIGLTVVHHIVHLLGTSLELASKVGKGSRFSVYLPVAEQEPDASANRDAEPLGVEKAGI